MFGLLVAGSFSLGDLAIPHISAASINAIRFWLAILVLAAAHRALLGSLPAAPPQPWRFANLGGLMATYFFLMFVALNIAPPISTGAVFTLMPLMSAAFGFLILSQRTTPIVLVSLLVAGAGAVWVIFRGDLDALLGFRVGRGEAIFFVGCACHALVASLVKKFNRGEHGLYFSFWSVTCTGIWLTLWAAPDLVQISYGELPAIVWLAIGYLAIFATAATFFLVQFASMRLPASKALSYSYITPAAVILIEGAIGHGWPSWSVLAGAGLTVVGLAIMAFSADR